MNNNIILFGGGLALGYVLYRFTKPTRIINFVGGDNFFKSEKAPPYTI